jgi:sortase A
MRLRNVVLMLAALTVVLMLAACSSSGQASDGGGKDQAGKDEQAQKQIHPEKATEGKKGPPKMTKEAKGKQIAPTKGKVQRKVANSLEPPKNRTLKLTIPAMKQIDDDTIPTGKGTNETLFHDHAAVHLRGTGFPWQRNANVYIAGHRIGFPGTDSNLAFYDLEDLEKGDKVYLKDADGREYTYQVFKKLIVEPTDLSVLNPVRGKNIVSLQTCTLPDYTKRVIYQAELTNVEI